MKPRKRFGQHFLEPAWVDKLIAAIEPAPDDCFLEIGAGRGALTLPLARRVARVLAIEIDRDLVRRLAASAPGNVRLIDGDILALDLATAIASDGQPEGRRWRIAGNLPYGISSPVLGRLVALHRASGRVSDATVLLQREVADRLSAEPGTRDYGVLGILIRLHADVERLLTLPPGAFRPPPRVRSALVRLRFRTPQVPLIDQTQFEKMVRTMFAQRRKRVVNALRPFAASTSLSAEEALARAGLDIRRRPETFALAELARLADVFAAQGDAPP